MTRLRRSGSVPCIALAGERSLDAAPDDRRPPALARRRSQAAGAHHAGRCSNSANGTAARSPRPAPSAARRCISCSGEAALAAFDMGGLEVVDADADAFARAPASENHTLKRALTDPRLFSRHRQRLFRRDPASRAAVAARADGEARRRPRVARLYHGDARRPRRVDDAAARGGGRRVSRTRSRRSARRWRCTAASASRARSAARRCSGSSAPRTSATIARAARPAATILADRALSRLLAQELAAIDRRAGLNASRANCVASRRRRDVPAVGVSRLADHAHMPSFDIVSSSQPGRGQQRAPDQINKEVSHARST